MRVLSVAARKLRTVTTFSAFEIALIAPVFVLLGAARVAVLCLPFRTYARHLGTQVGLNAPPLDLSDKATTRAHRVGRVVRSVAKVTPWQSLCLPQAMVAAFLMRVAGIPYQVFFGLVSGAAVKSPDPLAAHAWVRAGETNMTGGNRVGMFTVVAVFERRAKAAR